jgi:hypothetical protein
MKSMWPTAWLQLSHLHSRISRPNERSMEISEASLFYLTALNDSNFWLSVDFGGAKFIVTAIISKCYCGQKPSNPRGCLCRISNAKVSLIDTEGNTVQSKSLGDTCSILDVFVDFDDGCSGETDIPFQLLGGGKSMVLGKMSSSISTYM